MGIFAPWLGTVDPTALAPAKRTRLPSADYWFGTDVLGRDIYSRLLYGARVSLTVGLSVAVLSSLAGLAVGLVSGFVRWADSILMRFMDGLMSIPPILLAVALMALTRASVGNVILAITVAEIPRVSRLVRSVVLSLREQPYVDAATASGTRTPMIILRHILPNTLAPMLVQATYICAETLAIVGESGCGKSVTSMSLMRLIAEPPGKIAGSIRFQGKDLLQLSEREMRAIRGNDISMIFQEPMTSLNPVLTVGRQIGETLRMHQGLDKPAAEARAIEMLSLVGIPEPARRVREYPHQLSGGMRQRVMIAMALACNPKLLIADEPTTALDVTIQAQILQLMLDLKRRVGAAIVLITHDLGVVAEIAERVMVMYAGRKVEEAPVAELFRSPRHPYTQGLLGAVPKLGSSLTGAAQRLAEIPGQVPSLKGHIEGCVFAGRCSLATDLCRQVAPGLEEKAPRYIAACHYARKGGRGMSVPLLQVNDLKKHFPVRGGLFSRASKWVYAVDGVSFEVERGETLSLVGESGCGKSTVGRAILRLFDITAGQVVLDGQRIDGLSPGGLRSMRRRVQVVFQDPFSSLNPRMRVRDILAEPIRNFGLAKSSTELEAKVAALMDTVRLPRDALGRRPHEFSGGQRQRIGIARALAAEPELIVCDEAVSALDVSVKAQIVNLLQDLQREFGLALLFISHDLAIVEHMTHRVAVMYLGKIVEMAPKRKIFTAPRHPCTKALLSAVPVPEPGAIRNPIILKGDVPSPINPPSGCRFHTRCPFVFDRCRTEVPELRLTEGDEWVACHLEALPEAPASAH